MNDESEGGRIRFRHATLTAMREAASVVVLTGSGISAESGIPTFRGAGGLWEGYRAEELASPDGFRRHPDRVWEWYRWRIDLIRAAAPNPGHLALAALETHTDVTIITQNVDGLHQRAGSRRVIELHGSILRTKCSRSTCRRGDGDMPLEGSGVPICPCGAALRPAVVWFGESLPADALEAAGAAVQSSPCVLVIGTSALVMPAAYLPALAIRAGATVVEVNPDPTSISTQVHDCIRDRAGAVLPALVAAAFGPHGEEPGS